MGSPKSKFFEDGFAKWTAALPYQMQKDPRLKGMQGPGEAVRKWFELEDRAKGLQDQLQAAKDLGRLPDVPDSPAGYDLGEAPEGVNVNPDVLKGFLEACRENGVTNTAARAVFGMFTESVSKVYQERKAVLKEAMDGVKNEWGENFDGNKELARRALNRFGGEDLGRAIDGDQVLSTNPHVLRALYEVGRAISEGEYVGGLPKGRESGFSLNDAYPSMRDMPERRE